MNLTDTIKYILRNGKMKLPDIRNEIWKNYPQFRSSTKDATLTKIKNKIRKDDCFIIDENAKPKTASLNTAVIVLDINKSDIKKLEQKAVDNGIEYKIMLQLLIKQFASNKIKINI
jgi:uncharacterized glyoxalase superfamily protein PhnB